MTTPFPSYRRAQETRKLSAKPAYIGAASDFPENAIVEVPTLVQGDALAPQPVGELPEWLGGYTRLLAVPNAG